MICKLVVGGHAVCVDDDTRGVPYVELLPDLLVRGKVYTISAIIPTIGEIHDIGVQVAEHPWMVTTTHDLLYRHDRFRPLKRLRVEDFTSVMEDA